jgi:hypothetical protein
MTMFNLIAGKRPRLVLVIGDDGVMLAPFGVAGLADPVFAATRDEAARNIVLDHLLLRPKTPVTILSNVAAQEFRIEALPPLRVLDRPKLARRRLEQAFPDAYAAASRVADRSHALLACLHRGSAVASWLGALPPSAASLGLLPVEGARLAASLMPEMEKGWAMILARFRTGGFRQIVTRDGQFVFTRQTLALPASADPRMVAEAIARDLCSSLGYLSRFGLTEAANLRVALLLKDDQAATLRAYAAAGRLPTPNLAALSPHQAAKKLGLGFAPDTGDGDSDLLFAAYAAARPNLRLPLMPPAIKRRKQDAWIGRMGWRAATAAMVLALGMTGWSASQYGLRYYDNVRDGEEVAALRQRLVAEQESAASVAAPLGRFRVALERQRLFMEPQAMPWETLRQLGQGLEGKARLTALDWRDDESLRVDIRLIAGSGARSSDREAVVADFRALALELARAMPAYAVEVTRYPFPALPQEVLTNALGESPSTADAATAELAVRRRL